MFDVIYVYISIGIKTQRDVLQENLDADLLLVVVLRTEVSGKGIPVL